MLRLKASLPQKLSLRRPKVTLPALWSALASPCAALGCFSISVLCVGGVFQHRVCRKRQRLGETTVVTHRHTDTHHHYASFGSRLETSVCVFPLPIMVGSSPLPCWLGGPPLVHWAPPPLMYGGSLRPPQLFGASPLPSWLAPIFGWAVFPSLCLLERKEKKKKKKKRKGKKKRRTKKGKNKKEKRRTNEEKIEKKQRGKKKEKNKRRKKRTIIEGRRFCELVARCKPKRTMAPHTRTRAHTTRVLAQGSRQVFAFMRNTLGDRTIRYGFEGLRTAEKATRNFPNRGDRRRAVSNCRQQRQRRLRRHQCPRPWQEDL